MRASWKAGCLAAGVVLAWPSPGRTEGPAEPGPSHYPTLDGTTLAFIYDKMSGVTPDFRTYAQHSTAYTAASVFGRDRVFSDEMASLQHRFAALDVHGTYVVRLSVPLQQYDPASQAYGIGFGESSYIPFSDPVTYQRYGVQFTNRGVIEKIPMAPDAAEAYARRFNLPISGSYVGNAMLQMTFRIDAVPPAVGSGETMVDAAILAARLYTTDGRLMHDFAVEAPPPLGSPAPAALKAADIQGFTLSMPVDAVIAAGRERWTRQLGSAEEGVILFFNGLQQKKPLPATVAGMPNPFAQEWAVCAGQQSGRQNPDERGEGVGPPAFSDCIAVVETHGAVTRISSEQHLSGVDVTALKASLDAKYGTAVQTANDGNDRIWVGHDPADPNGREVRIEAAINTFRTPIVLTVTATSYARPGASVPASINATGAPKL